MALPFVFAAATAPTTPQLDANFNALGALTAIPCTVSGTNALALTPIANTPAIAAYVNYQPFSGVVATTNTTSATCAVSGLAALNIYKDTPAGPVVLVAGDLVASNAFVLVYDSALNAGVGGFHLITIASRPSIGAVPATVNNVAGQVLTAATLTGSGTGQAVILRTGAPAGVFNDTTDTAAAVVTSIPGAAIGTYFNFLEINSTGQTQTLLAGAGVTVSGVATTATGVTHRFTGVVTAVAVPAVTIFG